MAVSYREEDHGTYWADNEEIREKTKAYAKKAECIAKKGILFIGKNHPWRENARHSPCKVRIFDLEGRRRDLSSGPREFENARDLLLHWESASKEGATEKRKRRVIVLEDLSPRIAELLGVLLDIPPEFFLAHCNGSGELSVVNKQLFKQGSTKYWKVAVPQTRSLSRGINGTYRLVCGSFNRNSGMLEEGYTGHTLHFNSYVSYWASSHEAQSWTALVVADPHTSRLFFYPASNPNLSEVIHLKNFKSPKSNLYYEIMLDSVNDGFGQPHERSISDAVAKAYNDAPLEVTGDPFSATYVARNCIRAVWEQRVWWDESEVYETVYRNVWNHQISQSSLASEDFQNKMVIDNQTMSEYQELMRIQEGIRSNRHEIRAIIWKFRLRDKDYLSAGTPEFQNLMEQEAKLWDFLDEKLRYIDDFLNDHMKMYSARSTMEETYEAKMQSRESMRQTREANRQTAAANRMARSSGQLTKIATIIVPCTFVASIFSMGGDFAAGESLFYVYWIISVPITLGLLFWILHEDVADAVEKSKQWFGSGKRIESRKKPIEKSEA